MRNPRDFFKPLAVGAPDPLLEIPFTPVADDPLLRPVATRRSSPSCPTSPRRPTSCSATSRTPSPVDNKEAARDGPRQGRPRRSTSATPRSGRASTRSSRPWVLDDITTLVTEIGDKLDVIMVPKVEGAVGHPLRRPPARPARGEGRARAPDPRPRDPRDRARRGQPRGDRRRQPAHAGHELRPGRPRRLAADEDHARRRRPPRLPRALRPGPRRPRGAARQRPAGPLALLDRAAWSTPARRPGILPFYGPFGDIKRPRRLRGAVPRRVPDGLRRRLVAAPGPDRRRQEGLLAPTPTRSSSPRRSSRRSPTAAACT